MTDESSPDHSHIAGKPRRRWLRWVLGIVLAALLIGGIGVGFKAYRWSNMDGHERMEYMQDYAQSDITEALDLNAAQQQKLAALIETLKRQRQHFAFQAWREQAQEVIGGPQFDRNGAQALVDHIVQAVQNASPEVITAAASFYDSLDTGQQAEIRERFSKAGRRGRRREHN